MSGWCLVASGFLSVRYKVVALSQGSVSGFWFFEPSTTRPVFGFLFAGLLFFLYGLFVDAVCSLSLSLRRWGNPNLFGLGFPLCFFILDTLSALDPYIFLLTFPKASLPHLFFFLSSSSLVSGSVFSRFLSCRCWWSWWVFFCPWSWSLSGCCVTSVSFLGLVALSSFFWVGGVPLAAFSPPLVSWFGVDGLGISAVSCILHLLCLASRATWSSDLQPPRPPQPLVLVRATSPVSCWESSVRRAETKGCGVTGGFVTPRNV